MSEPQDEPTGGGGGGGGGGGSAQVVVERLVAAVDAAVGLDWSQLSGSAVDEAVVAVIAAQARLGGVEAVGVAALEADGGWATEGFRSVGSKVAYEVNESARRARRRVGDARKLRGLGLLSAALSAGRVSADAARLILRADTADTHDLVVEHEKVLVGLAESAEYVVFERAMAYWCQLADPGGAERKAANRERARGLHLSETLGGRFRLDGWLTAMAGAEVGAELGRLEQRLFEADWAEARERLGDRAKVGDLCRTADQRRHDALVEMARRSAAAGCPDHHHTGTATSDPAGPDGPGMGPTGDRGAPHGADPADPADPGDLTGAGDAGLGATGDSAAGRTGDPDGSDPSDPAGTDATSGSAGPGGQPGGGGGCRGCGSGAAPAAKPVVTLHMDYETFIAELARHTGADVAYPAERLCELDDGTVLVPSEALNAALGGEVRRIVFGADGEILDFGRRRRLFTATLAAAIGARDRECFAPGCHLPAAECQTDHVVEWHQGGVTSAGNGQPGCRFHNQWKHLDPVAERRLRQRHRRRFGRPPPPPGSPPSSGSPPPRE